MRRALYKYQQKCLPCFGCWDMDSFTSFTLEKLQHWQLANNNNKSSNTTTPIDVFYANMKALKNKTKNSKLLLVLALHILFFTSHQYEITNDGDLTRILKYFFQLIHHQHVITMYILKWKKDSFRPLENKHRIIITWWCCIIMQQTMPLKSMFIAYSSSLPASPTQHYYLSTHTHT